MLWCPEPSLGFPMEVMVTQTVKRLPTMREIRVQSLGREDLLEKKWQPTPVFLPGKSLGRWNLVAYSPWGRKEWDTTEQLHFNYVGHEVELHEIILQPPSLLSPRNRADTTQIKVPTL